MGFDKKFSLTYSYVTTADIYTEGITTQREVQNRKKYHHEHVLFWFVINKFEIKDNNFSNLKL